ncbi:hypothetical protein QA635_34940 [Bradyrhizobium brasilense]|nr:hypothetical protein [Bradyrhizobium australafricanum]WFU31648.1 hypothetical protein QA635_34940 [Bradyrhizobium australafricanum]
MALELLRNLGLGHFDEIAGHVGAQDLRMDITLAADCRRIAELLRQLLDDCDDTRLVRTSAPKEPTTPLCGHRSRELVEGILPADIFA